MSEKLSTSAVEVLEAAQVFAKRSHHRRTGTGHLLVGLSLNQDLARRVLIPQGVTTDALRRQVLEVFGPGDTPTALERPFTADAQTVIEEAEKIATSTGHVDVWPEHLLLAITSFGGEGCRVLVRSGADPDQVAKLATGSLNSLHLTKDLVNFTVTDTSAGSQHLTHQITRTARALVPRDHQPAREVVLQAVVINAPLEKGSKAVVSVLNDQFAWTELLALPVSEWRSQVPLPDRHGDVDVEKLTTLADDLLGRAARILGA